MKTVWQIELMLKGSLRTDVCYSRTVYASRDMAEANLDEFKRKCLEGISYGVSTVDVRYVELMLKES